MLDPKWTKEKVKEYVEGVKTNGSVDVENKCARSLVDLDDAFKAMQLDKFVTNAIITFSDQVTCVCSRTGVPLFDLERAKKIREKLDKVFKDLLATIDEEIEENS